MNVPRAFVMGIGIVNSTGTGCAATLDALRNGARAIRPLSCFSPSGRSPVNVGEVANFPFTGAFPRTHEMALGAAREALASTPHPPDAIVLGGTTGGMPHTETLLRERDSKREHFGFHGTGSVADCLAGELGCTGPVFTVSTACSSGTVALKVALELIRSGKAGHVLVGGADALCRLTYYGFDLLQLVDPNGARPLDEARVGMTVGEGAAMLLLVSGMTPPENAVVELLGGGLTCDAYHPSAPHPGGEGALEAMKSCLSDAGVSPYEIDYINLHGTGTPANDTSEARAILALFLDNVPPVSSTKGMFGHSLAASGAMEAVVAALCIQHGLIPANTGCSKPDPALKLTPVAEPENADVNMVLSNSFGFGGQNACVAIASTE